jgi:aspartyl-tRNA(Asn)/glutamyl-tRNA(Gln) amidotransferase subunit A
MIAFASSLDQAGVMATSAEDAALMLQAMSGFDEMDSTSVDRPVEDYSSSLSGDVKGLRIGIPREHFGEGLDPRVAERVREALKIYESMGARLVDVELPNTELSIPAYYVVAPAECSSNLSRFDGVRFGYRAENPTDLEDLYKRSRTEGFGPEVQRRIMIGTYVLSAGYYDAYYLQAQRLRRLISADYTRAFQNVDVLMGPTTPDVAFRFGEKSDDPVTMYLCDIYTNGVNLAGLPGMSIPVVGDYFQEARLLSVAHALQRETDWHLSIPEGYA